MRIGTIGSGAITAQFISAVQATPGMEITAVYSRQKSRAEAFAAQTGVKSAYDNLLDLVSDDDIEVVYVASPNSMHYNHCKQALEAGKHVICEKPFTSTALQLSELITLAKEHNLMLFEAISVIYMPNFALIKQYLPVLGRIRMVQCNYSQYSSKYPAFLEKRLPNVFNPAFSGGALMDINVYNLHFLCELFGEPQQVHYLANRCEGIDTSGIVTAQYADFVAVCSGAKDSFSLNFAQIQGEKGYLNVTGGINGCAQIHLQTAQETTILNAQLPLNRLLPEVQALKDMLIQKDYARCHSRLEQSLRVMRLLDAARSSAGIHFPADSLS
ncbi:oxidoreductase [Superficieibacter electus]|uniref:Oxidoreductase n=1 Tax=Superficieibacter electus TaxID=2022662 RepID=A0A2P5GU59_9ENTR|nr:Gfo/Idh/MocA family oxidoreductase [Superficieibacter electus]POP47233.1 oxidoreductase [Superficieibacter electus]POP50079.1 oxidoreductase [Superficieibacter electus]